MIADPHIIVEGPGFLGRDEISMRVAFEVNDRVFFDPKTGFEFDFPDGLALAREEYAAGYLVDGYNPEREPVNAAPGDPRLYTMTGDARDIGEISVEYDRPRSILPLLIIAGLGYYLSRQ